MCTGDTGRLMHRLGRAIGYVVLAVLFSAASGCGSSGEATDGPGTGGSAARGSAGASASTAGSGTGVSAADTVTWAEDVAPIFFEECVACHRPDGPGPFSLRRYAPARARAELIARHTARRYMPPWLPEPGYVDFEGERRLTDTQIRTIGRWAEAGAPPGDSGSVEPPPLPPSGWQLGEPDLVIEMDSAYAVPADADELFRSFVIPIPVDSARWVRGVELLPGADDVVHHAMMMVDTTRSSRRMDAGEPGPGFDTMVQPPSAFIPYGFFLAWTPGRVPALAPEGLSWRLKPGTDLVLQLHIRPVDEPRELRSRIGFYFTDRPPDRIPFTLKLTSQIMDIPPGDGAYTVRDSFRLPVDVRALGVYPHAHYLGKRIHLFARLPDGSRRWLLRIDDWNFNWQDDYRFAEPISIPAGSEIRMRLTYDNSADNPQNPNSPPERVVYGPKSSDEMGDVYLQVTVDDSTRFQRLYRALGRKDFRSKLAGWRHTLEIDPADPYANVSMGNYLRSAGRLDSAMWHYRRAMEGDPDHMGAHYSLATALEEQGRLQAAAAEYRRVLQLQPGVAAAHYNLANVLRAQGRPEAALRHYREVIRRDSSHAEAHNNLGYMLRARGELEGALRHLRRAVSLRPGYLAAEFNLGLALQDLGAVDSALVHLRRAVALGPERPEPYRTLAWTLATHPDSGVRAPEEAVRNARRAAELAGTEDSRTLAVLAAAYASAGRFEEAVSAVDRAIERARASGESDVARSLQQLRELFSQGRPYLRSG